MKTTSNFTQAMIEACRHKHGNKFAHQSTLCGTLFFVASMPHLGNTTAEAELYEGEQQAYQAPHRMRGTLALLPRSPQARLEGDAHHICASD
jgi:hypothetical protein